MALPQFGDRGADRASWSSKLVTPGDWGNKISEPIGNSLSVVLGFSTTELFSMIIRGITSLSDHSGKSAAGSMYIKAFPLASVQTPGRRSVSAGS